MKKTRVTVSLDPSIEEWLRAASERTGKSVSHVIRLSLEEYAALKPDRFSRSDKARKVSENAWLKSEN
ncbi:ribbon-helix-helix protein, CopG family [Parasedimentitalea maritima]|uniref:Ribbon-helix-helix protein, CopG family n=1 Tax=Parasedimentitalea maritima TaxID=2578117 RepID=A0A6A4RDI7_9RHOB|nr:ribbon-helix-helix protein, CopG family [Zongyanglinia marina]